MTALDDFIAELRPPGPRSWSCRCTSGSRSSSRRSGSRATPSSRRALDQPRERRRARTSCWRSRRRPASRRSSSSTTTTTAAATAVAERARRVSRAAQGRAARRALPRSRAPALVPRRLHRRRRASTVEPPARSATRVREMQLSWERLVERAAGRVRGRRRARRLDAAVHRHGPRAPRAPATACLDVVRDRGHRRRPRRVRHRPRRRRDLHARLPRRARDRRPRGVGRRPLPASRRATDAAEPASPAAGRPQPGPRRLRALRPARRPGPVPAGPAGRHARATRRSSGSRCCASDAGRAADVDAACSTRSTTASPIGGVVIVDDYDGRRTPAQAVDDVPRATRHRRAARARRRRRRRRGARRRRPAAAAPRCTDEPSAAVGGRGAAARRPRPADAVDLSVVVVFYNMRREAARTLHSLVARVPARASTTLDYEVIVVENGSRPTRSSARSSSRASVPSSATSTSAPRRRRRRSTRSTAGSASRGRQQHRVHDRRRARAHAGRAAVRASPGLAHLRARDRRHPAVVRRSRASSPTRSTTGYDQAYEDELFRRRSSGRTTGTGCSRSATSSATATGSTGCGRATASSCPARCSSRSAAFDERFSMAGGGYANLELYERLGATPGVNVVTILGEGSFHQVHGGTTTNRADPDERRARVSATPTTSPSCAAGRSAVRARRSTTSGTMPSPRCDARSPRRRDRDRVPARPLARGPDGAARAATPDPRRA